ncbi:helicase SEN1-like, partial [Neltuma alba]|uniref:helicase SEN1-like n=1 Tax=Neltuma alba TaxID=207710 RepID=UPI0010A51C10
VLMFPILLENQPLFTEFESFVEAIDNMHELALSGHQQFPGVYALLFCKRSVRSVGYRLAGSMGRLSCSKSCFSNARHARSFLCVLIITNVVYIVRRRATDLEPLQPMLKKFIACLEAETLPSAMEYSTPQPQPDRASLWVGFKSLLGFMDSPAFEEGLLEHYPFFLDIVLNHISSDSVEFSHAVTCLRLLFEMLGCKLWLRSKLSPSVMRNTLLGQCFHTRSEKIHKDIFSLFQPFLQSLEALQDGEHEKQRRNFLYFLLHQVSVSCNFSILTRKLACQISLLVVHRGYTMNPPSPPFECAHMWGPSLVSSLKDSSLHSSLRQPAFDLMQTIIVSDATALISSVLNHCTPISNVDCMEYELKDDNDKLWLSTVLDKEKDISSWSQFDMQSRVTSQECREWMCIPLLWVDVLADMHPSILPISFSKAVFWARSRFSMVDPESSAEMLLPIRTWLSTYISELSSSFEWKVPTGSDDGGNGDTSKNSVEVLTMSSTLMRTFSRLTAHFLVQMVQGELRRQWTWEPQMGESLILSLLDPNDSVRQFGKCILEQVSDTRGLSCGLRFLCSCKVSLSATFLGLKHAMKLMQLDSVLLKFQTLHHFWFLLFKLLKEGDLTASELPEKAESVLKVPTFSSQGGFLKQPDFDSLPVDIDKRVSDVDLETKEKFSYLLSEMAWPIICRYLGKGKEFIDYNLCQMTCVRILEILPVLFQRLQSFCGKKLGTMTMLGQNKLDFRWLSDLMEWGKSSLKVVIVYWKRTVTCLLNILKGSCANSDPSAIVALENLISSDGCQLQELMEHVSRLSVSLSSEGVDNFLDASEKPRSSVSENTLKSKCFTSDRHSSLLEDTGVQIGDPQMLTSKKNRENVIVLSDDEGEPKSLSNKNILSDGKTGHSKSLSSDAGKNITVADPAKHNVSSVKTSRDRGESVQGKVPSTVSSISSQKLDSDNLQDKPVVTSFVNSKVVDHGGKEANLKSNDLNLTTLSEEPSNAVKPNKACDNMTLYSGTMSTNPILSDLVRDNGDDPLETALKSVGRTQLYIAKPTSVSRRQVIQLKTPFENRSGRLHRLEDNIKRFKPPTLNDWYKPILEIDYFAIVGLASARKDESQAISKLKEVPLVFQSPEQYVEIFRPLVLEEFKAQLHNSFVEMSSWEGMISGKLSVMSVERVDDFHLVRFIHDNSDSAESKSFSENDLVLLTKDPPQKSSHDVHMVGKVERCERGNKRSLTILLIRFYFQNGSSRLNQARRALTERSKWHACRIMSIISQIREFNALSSVKGIPLLPLILNPLNDSCHHNEFKEVDLSKLPQPLQKTFRSSFNASQLQAISVTIGTAKEKKKFELSLIQGPPGTGKTRIIVAIVSGLLAYPSEMSCTQNPSNENLSSSTRPKVSQGVAIARAWQDAALARQLSDDVQTASKYAGNCVRRRVLICAQSNAAVDELVSRISSQGLYGSNGKMYKPYLVRVGNVKTVHPDSLPFFIDTLVDQRVAEERMHSRDGKDDLRVDSSGALRSSLEKLVDSIRFYEAKRASSRDGNSKQKNLLHDDSCKGDEKEMSDTEIEMQLRKLYEQKKQIYKDLNNVQAEERKANEEIKALRNKLRKSILREAEIVVTTLSGCGGDLYGVCSETMLSSKFGGPSENTLFDAVVVDEAAQALEPATLIPLQLLKSSGTKCIMVGDPKQLPATVLSNVASKFLYECSMFERLQRAGHTVIMLNEQYRMHPEICKFPSLHFYESKLLNGCDMPSKSASFHQTRRLGPYVFYDIIDGQELHGKNSGVLSLYNQHEADAAVELLRFFRKRYPAEFIGRRMGVITPYKYQLSLLRSRFSNVFGSSNIANIEFNTVDGFQGREVDILLLSTVRAARSNSAGSGIKSSSIGFVADVRRMNVALTRAKVSLWILGNARTLQTNSNWAALVKDAKERNLIISAKMPYHKLFKTAFNNDSAENSANPAVPPKHERVKSANQSIAKNSVNEKDASVGKKKGIATQVGNISNGSETGSLGSGKDAQGKKKDKKGEPVSIVKDTSRLVANYGCKTTCDGTPPLDESVGDSGRKGKDKIMHDAGKAILGKRHYGKRETTAGGHKISPLAPSVRRSVSSGGDKNSSPEEVSAPSKEDCTKKRDTEDEGRAPIQNRVSDISKRKQQREAVNAILCTSLITSKKAETSKTSAKRHIPSTAPQGSAKPSKRRTVKSVPSAPE